MVCRTIGSKVTSDLVLPGFDLWQRPCWNNHQLMLSILHFTYLCIFFLMLYNVKLKLNLLKYNFDTKAKMILQGIWINGPWFHSITITGTLIGKTDVIPKTFDCTCMAMCVVEFRVFTVGWLWIWDMSVTQGCCYMR